MDNKWREPAIMTLMQISFLPSVEAGIAGSHISFDIDFQVNI